MSHTPAPWLYNQNSNWKTNPFSVTVRKYGVHSATVANIPTRMTVPPEEQMANARLIAAAPELLDALRLMLEDFGPDYAGPTINAARAAINKATGEA